MGGRGASGARISAGGSDLISVNDSEVAEYTQTIKWTPAMSKQLEEVKAEARRIVNRNIDMLEPGAKMGASRTWDAEQKWSGQHVKETKTRNFGDVYDQRKKVQLAIFNKAAKDFERDLRVDTQLGLIKGAQDILKRKQYINVTRSKTNSLLEELKRGW